MENELFLVYINPIGKDSSGLNEYEFFFSETPEIVWGEDWNVACPSACGNLLPDSTTYSHIEILKTEMEKATELLVPLTADVATGDNWLEAK